MEKKTIGKFIAVLRKANGMTQQDLGDKLFVSDKTVSRWERDECNPDLSLIPAIAEIFGITTDELLRGERNNIEAIHNEDTQQKPSAKSEKQFKAMLHSRMKKYNNLSLISVGVLIVGLLAAIVCNVVFSEGLLGFCISALFIVASAICLYCFAENARIPLDDDEVYVDRVNEANTKITRTATAIYYAIIAVFTFCTPLVTQKPHWGIRSEDWFGLGLIIVPCTLAICGLIHLIFIKPQLIKHGMITLSEEKMQKSGFRRKIIGRITVIGGSILVLLITCGFILAEIGTELFLREKVYESLEDFKEAMIEDQAEFVEEYRSLHYIDKDGNKVYMHSDIPDDYMLKQAVVTDFSGEVILEYSYNTTLYMDIKFSNKDGRVPVTVISNDDYYDARSGIDTALQIIGIIMFLDIIVSITVYFVKAYGKKSKRI